MTAFIHPHEVVLSNDWSDQAATVKFNRLDRTFETGRVDMLTASSIEDGREAPLPLGDIPSDVKAEIVGWLFDHPRYDQTARAHAKFLSMASSIEGNG